MDNRYALNQNKIYTRQLEIYNSVSEKLKKARTEQEDLTKKVPQMEKAWHDVNTKSLLGSASGADAAGAKKAWQDAKFRLDELKSEIESIELAFEVAKRDLETVKEPAVIQITEIATRDFNETVVRIVKILRELSVQTEGVKSLLIKYEQGVGNSLYPLLYKFKQIDIGNGSDNGYLAQFISFCRQNGIDIGKE